ncbi:MAG: hypothetical protein U0521_26420 [Anaerolineae bacterium]
MTISYFAFATTLAGLTNAETVLHVPPQVMEGGRIPCLRPSKARGLDSSVVRNGKINVPLRLDALTEEERIAFNTFLFGSQSVAGKQLYASALDEFRFFSPYAVYVDRPYEGQDYRLVPGGAWVRDLVLPCSNWTLQTATINSSGAVTTSQHYVQSNTSSGSVTLDLPALSGVIENVVYSFHKTHASNSLVLDPNSSETIDGASTKTLTANGARVDIIKSGSGWVTVKSGSMV